MLIIPYNGLADAIQNVVIEEYTYEFHFTYNTREAAWYLSIGDVGEPPSVKTKIRTFVNLLDGRTIYSGVPNGRLYTMDTVASYGRVDRDGFYSDGRFKLIYLTEEEAEEIENEV